MLIVYQERVCMDCVIAWIYNVAIIFQCRTKMFIFGLRNTFSIIVGMFCAGFWTSLVIFEARWCVECRWEVLYGQQIFNFF